MTQPTGHWTEEERARVCHHLAGVMGHVRLLLIGNISQTMRMRIWKTNSLQLNQFHFADSQVFAEEVEPTGAVPMELSLERYRNAALQTSQKIAPIPASGGGGSGNTFPNPQSMVGTMFNENDKRLQPRLLLNMFPGTTILKNDKLHFQATLNGW